MSETDRLVRFLAVFMALLLLAPLLLMAVFMPVMGWWMYGGHAAMPGTVLLFSVVPVVVLLLVGYGAYRLVRTRERARRDPAVAELRRAYARGDLTTEEFDRRRDRLAADASGEDAGKDDADGAGADDADGAGADDADAPGEDVEERVGRDGSDDRTQR